jgi:hypothetical protein
MTQHTPGPWTIDRGNIKGPPHEWPLRQGEVGKVSAVVVAQVRDGDDGSYSFYPRATAKANARLISAAPTLLAACNAILDRVDATGGTIRSITGDDVAAIRAAVAEAMDPQERR